MAQENAEQIAKLLPFWINGSLSPDEAAAVAAAVAANPALAAEAAFLRGLRDRMQAEAPGYSPGEIGLARLKRSIALPAAPPPSGVAGHCCGTRPAYRRPRLCRADTAAPGAG